MRFLRSNFPAIGLSDYDFKPELREGSGGEILSFLEPYFWIESRLWPLLTISLLNAVYYVFLYGKFLKNKEEKR